jgi:hypothetical protein
MDLQVFVFLLVVCILLSMTLLWRLGWFHLRPPCSQGRAKRGTFHHLLKLRSPDDCPCAGYVRRVTHDEIADAVG